MMTNSNIMLWRGLEEIKCDQSIIDGVVKICAVESDIIALCQDNSVYHATLDNASTVLEFVKVPEINAIDIAYGGSKLVIYVNQQGQVFQCDPKSWHIKNEVILREEVRQCSQGHKIPSRKVKIKNVSGGEFGVLYVSRCGQLWGSGCMPQIGINSSEPKKVSYFQGRAIYQTAVGENFAMVVVRKKICEDDTESENDEDVFGVECTECQAVSRVSTPTSQASQLDTCPLGVQVSRSSEDTTTHSADNREDTSLSTEDSELNKIHFDSKQDTSSGKKNQSDNTELILEPISEDNQKEAMSKRTTLDDKPNMIFINTEAAKQFLTKQLSWVSAGEDYLVECTEKPTRIIKENVSNLTNLVVESVKTVGDKVATLSRHMSGGSETNDGHEGHFVEELNPLIYSLTSSYKLDEIQISSSTMSDKDNLHNLVNERAKMLVKIGQNLINSEVWVWGDENKGQLGTGDLIKRTMPNSIVKLSNVGVYKITCGKSHCAAVTLDGRMFCWGHNAWHQVCINSTGDKSSPVQFTANSNTDRVWDVACGDNHTLVYTLESNMFFLGKHLTGHTNTIENLKDRIPNDFTSQFHYKVKHKNHFAKKPTDFFNTLSNDLNFNSHVLSSGIVSLYHSYLHNNKESPALQDLAIEQQFLEEMLLVHQYLIKPLLKKVATMSSNSDVYDTLCSTYTDIMYFTAVNVLSVWKYTDGYKRAIEIVIIQNSDEHISLYEKYLQAVCNLIAINGFNQMSIQLEVPVAIQNLFADKIPSSKQKNIKTVSESIISCAILHPLNRLNTYKCMVQSFIRYNTAMSPMEIKSFIEQRLQDVVSKLDSFNEFQEKKNREANITKTFWESAGKNMEVFRLSERRVLRESKTNPLNLLHSGRFSSHWFILLNDILIHVNGSNQNVHPLVTLWVEPIADTDSVQNAIYVLTPEESFTLTTPTSEERSDWLNALQSAIKLSLNKVGNSQPPLIRTASYTYTNKSQMYKEAKYVGRWYNGKLHGTGKIEWPDGKNYLGQFHNNQIHGQGRMETPNVGVYEGQWKDNFQNGFGVMKYCSGDIYEGYFKDGLAHGHGVRKQGDFTSSTATIYMGEWAQGVKQGYGVMDDIGKGEKYLGSWSDNKKNGCGLIVTLDGIYYEGVFMNDTLTGHGVMVFEDGTHYEGEFRSAGVFSGKGVLTFSSGDKIEGTLSGAWTDGVKISGGVLHMNVSNPALPPNAKPKSFGLLCVPPNQKWNGLFRHCFQQLGVPDNFLTQSGDQTLSNHPPNTFTKKIWQNVAVLLSNAQKDSASNGSMNSSLMHTPRKGGNKILSSTEALDVIPHFGQTSLTLNSYVEIKQYLCKACEMTSHPISQLVSGCAAAFNASYGGVRVHPLLLSHAVLELGCVSSRIYSAIRLLFPALPASNEYVTLRKNPDVEDDLENSEVISVSSVVQPLLLPRVHPSLHVLYALHHQKEDVAYWKRLLKWNRQTDVTLMAFLGIDQKFWIGYATRTGIGTPPFSPVKDQLFSEAVDTLQHIKTTFSPMEKLLVIKNTFQQMTTSVQKDLGSSYLWTMDELFPVFHFVVVRARILQLGSEIHFIEDFLEPCMQNGELGIMFTTLKACYYQILQEKVTICD